MQSRAMVEAVRASMSILGKRYSISGNVLRPPPTLVPETLVDSEYSLRKFSMGSK